MNMFTCIYLISAHRILGYTVLFYDANSITTIVILVAPKSLKWFLLRFSYPYENVLETCKIRFYFVFRKRNKHVIRDGHKNVNKTSRKNVKNTKSKTYYKRVNSVSLFTGSIYF